MHKKGKIVKGGKRRCVYLGLDLAVDCNQSRFVLVTVHNRVA